MPNKPTEAERKARSRARNKAGYVHVSGYTDIATAPEIEKQLLTAAEVDRLIEEKGERDNE